MTRYDAVSIHSLHIYFLLLFLFQALYLFFFSLLSLANCPFFIFYFFYLKCFLSWRFLSQHKLYFSCWLFVATFERAALNTAFLI